LVSSQLSDASGEQVRVTLLFDCMLGEFIRDRLGVQSRRHEVMTFVPKDAYDFGGQCLVQHAQYSLEIGLIALRDRTLLYVLARASAELLNVGKERLSWIHGCHARGEDARLVRGRIRGAGKSTLLHLLGGLDRPSNGTIYYGDREISGLTEADRADFRNREIGFVWQIHYLLPEFTALENVMMPLLIRGLVAFGRGLGLR
jgi:hypothetical protein